MPVSTRKSTFGVATVADSSAEAVTAILNDEAGSTLRTSGRKRERPSEAHERLHATPSKRVAVEVPASSAPTTTRQSGRLKARASLSAPTLAPRGDLFLFPTAGGADGTEPGQGTREAEPVKKARRLKQPRQPEESPFKGRGVLETRSTARVNLDDSPAHQPARHLLRKVAKSLQRSRRPPAQEESTRPPTRSANHVPFQGEDILDVAHRQGHSTSPVADPGPNLPPSLHQETANHETTARTQARHQKQSKARKPLARVVRRSSNDGPPLEADVTNRDEAEESRLDETGGTIDATTPRPVSTSQRPEAEAERRRREQAEAEEEAKRQQQIEAALRGIEGAVAVQECQEAWLQALVGSAQLREVSPNEPKSTLGKAAARTFKTLTREYRKRAGSNPPTPQESAQVLEENYRVLKERCKHLGEYKNRADMFHDRDRARMIRDIYGRLIPDSLKLDKAALKALFQDDQPSLAAYEEMYQLLQITNLLVETATGWLPRPNLEKREKSIVKHDIGPSVTEIMERYQDVITDQGRIKFVNDLETRQKLDLEKTLATHQQRMAEKLARFRADMNSIAAVPALLQPSSQPSSQPVVDVDDLDVDDHLVLDRDCNGAAGAHLEQATFAARPRVKREDTEEIPAPGPIQWEKAEIKVLVKGLREYQTARRFEDIVYVYGGPGGGLEKYDMDQIMAQAKWLKRSMAVTLRENQHDRNWDWLRSVPG